MRVFGNLKKYIWFKKVKRFLKQVAGQDVWFSPQLNAKTIRYGDWCFIPNDLSANSIVYSLGVGEDIVFDVEISKSFNVVVDAFDPTPNTIEWLKNINMPTKFNFHSYGVSNLDEKLKLYPLVIQGKKSSAMFTLDKSCSSDAAIPVDVQVKRLGTIMKELNHQHIDILKMDIEGAEYDVIDDFLRSGLDVKQLLVEFHHRFKSIGKKKTNDVIKKLNKKGYKIFFISEKGYEYSFIKTQ